MPSPTPSGITIDRIYQVDRDRCVSAITALLERHGQRHGLQAQPDEHVTAQSQEGSTTVA